MQAAFFLGANSKHGFYSLYDDLIDLEHANAVHIIKGSPGCGKSSFMRRIMQHALNAGHDVEQIFCSSDPDSLDGIIIPSLGIAFVDGTSPHVVEPKYPIAVEQYLNLSSFADCEAIRKHKSEIIEISRRYRGGYDRIYRLISASAALEAELFDTALGGVEIERLHKKAHGIISREIHGRGHGGAARRRFLSAISPKGYVTLFDTIPKMATQVYVLDDNFGLGTFLLSPIADAALDASFDVYLAYSPLLPERLEHVIIPELSLAFVTSKKSDPYPGEYKRRVRIDAMINPELLHEKKKKLSFSRKLASSMLTEACNSIADGKLIHDQIEECYNPYIDFDGVYALADELAKNILG